MVGSKDRWINGEKERKKAGGGSKRGKEGQEERRKILEGRIKEEKWDL